MSAQLILLLIAAPDLTGVWEAYRGFGPEVRGTLTITKTAGEWRAEIGGDVATVDHSGGELRFALPGERGSFIGRVSGAQIKGHWTQPATAFLGYPFASPVLLTKQGDRYRGTVTPADDEATVYLVVGPTNAFLRDPQRNMGVFQSIDRAQLVERDGMLRIPIRGATFDFTRAKADSRFHPRAPGAYRYRPPSREQDGWPVAALEDVGIARAPIVELIQMLIDQRTETMSSLDLHGILIARRGKLVLEEYFHGYHREKPHDTRSASKSLAAVLVGAAIQSGAKLSPSTKVFPDDPDPRKQAVTLEHLLTMSSGLDCDDSDPKSLGNEEVMQDQTKDPDWWHYTMALPMVRDPGSKSIYCSASTNLVGAILERTTGEPIAGLFHRSIAEPLQLGRYHLVLMPTGKPYLGGGIRWLPRDFMKLGQLMLDGGTWGGRRLLSKDWVARSVAPAFDIFQSPLRRYGYAWWITEYSHEGRTLSAYYAAGNGGQLVIVVPELELVVALYGGNYSDRNAPRLVFEHVPKYILPAVDPSLVRAR